MTIIDGGVTAAKGFKAANTAAAIKYKDRDDMAMIVSEEPCVAAGTFTKNVVKAAPVIFDRELVNSGRAVHAIVCNAGIANACTGEEGFSYCIQTSDAVSKALGTVEGSTLVASTGVIGFQLPMDRIKSGIDALSKNLSDTREAANKAARAIMTTDTKPKEVAVQFELDGKTVTIGGMCKGSGMIHPNMCTMLSFITTDAKISHDMLQKALSATVEDSYNMISVDGDTSTNDTCVIIANGLADNEEIVGDGVSYDTFVEALMEVNTTLAKMMAGDGEGATCLFEVKVVNAASVEEAKILSKSVVTSSLTKAAIYGHDANSGRILCALGYAGIEFDPTKIDIYFESANGKVQVIKDGMYAEYSEDEATKVLTSDAVTAICDMHRGEASATAWGCDLTHEYVSINADYRS